MVIIIMIRICKKKKTIVILRFTTILIASIQENESHVIDTNEFINSRKLLLNGPPNIFCEPLFPRRKTTN